MLYRDAIGVGQAVEKLGTKSLSRCLPPRPAASHAAAAPARRDAPVMKASSVELARARRTALCASAVTSPTRRSASGCASPVRAMTIRTR